MKFQIYWKGWWRLWLWWTVYPADEDGPPELYFGFGPFQFHKYVWDWKWAWRLKNGTDQNV